MWSQQPLERPACLACVALRPTLGWAVAVLAVDLLYGVALVVTHSLLLGELDEAAAAAAATAAAQDRAVTTSLAAEMSMAQKAGGLVLNSWYLQLWDLDLSWGHRLLGFEDTQCLGAGLAYGILVIVASASTLHGVTHHSPVASTAGRWFVVFAHVQIVLYAFLVFVKLPKLCDMEPVYFPKLMTSCSVLRYQFVQAGVVRVVLASAALWVFASFDRDSTGEGLVAPQEPSMKTRHLYSPVSASASPAIAGHMEPMPVEANGFNFQAPRTAPAYAAPNYSLANNFRRGQSHMLTSDAPRGHSYVLTSGDVPRSTSINVPSHGRQAGRRGASFVHGPIGVH